jgi:hypothetical protein
MGLLDDAIREHLELKRRHGADPSEVARQEHEALGPARREPDPAPVAVEPEPESYAAEPDLEPFPAEPEPEAEPAPEPWAAEPAPVEPEQVEPEPEPQAPPARRIDPELVDQPTVEHPAARPEPLEEDAEDLAFDRDVSQSDASQGQEEPDSDDVLEGTPEFLEETPEHDRLWFEQRPPRDFDFDD